MSINRDIIPRPSKEVARTTAQAVRLIEVAMLNCKEADIPALDCLLQARRALSPLVDERKMEPLKVVK